MTPIDLQTMVLLHQAGWNLDRIFRVCVASMNEVRNAEPTNRPTPPRPPDFKTFLRIAEAMAELEDDGLLDLGLTVTNPESKPEVLMLIEEEGRNTPLAQQLFLDLRLDPEASVYRLTTAASGGGGRHDCDHHPTADGSHVFPVSRDRDTAEPSGERRGCRNQRRPEHPLRLV